MQRPTLAFDIGGTRIKAGVVNADNSIMSRGSIWTEGQRGIRDVIARAGALGRTLLSEAGVGEIDGVGVACTGVIDSETGTVIQLNGKFPDIEGTSVGSMLSETFGAPARVDNDGRAFCIGEWKHGAAKGATDAVCITIGTGIGSGVVLNNHVLRTRGHLGGILGGHITLDPDGEWCSCGNRGCMETVGSVTALLNKVSDYVSRGHESVLADYVHAEVGKLTGEVVLEAYRKGDAVAKFVVDRWLQWLGAGSVALIHSYDPEVLVIGGGIVQAAPEVAGSIAAYVAKYAWTSPPGRVNVVAANLGDDAALIGAAQLVRSDEGLDTLA